MFFWNSLAKVLWKIRANGTGGRGNLFRLHRCATCEERGKDFSGRASYCSTALSKCPGSWWESRLSFSHHHERIPEKVQTRVSSEVVISPQSSVKGLQSHALLQLPQLCCQGQKDESCLNPGSVPLCKWFPDWSQLALRISTDLNFLVKDIQVSVICYSMIMMFMKVWLNVCHWYRLESFICL